VYVNIRSHRVATITPELTDILIKHLSSTQPDSMSTFILHGVHGKACIPNPGSCFNQRDSHSVVEIIGATRQESEKMEAYSWADAVSKELQETNLLMRGEYPALTDPSRLNSRDWYGETYDKLIKLKKRVDGGDFFQFAVPSLA
jgi:hypothetical protein